ncbi:MAG: Ada metal-binding domain-containing protein [Bdellovibrionota bacterium]
MDRATLYKAVLARDKRFDGRFYVGVRTTGIYCRPVCPARPLLKNIDFYRSQAEAEGAGFRPCLRCRPDIAPSAPLFEGTGAVVKRALRMIAEGQADSLSLIAFASKLGLTDRHLRHLFAEHVGAAPVEVAASKRLHTARLLLSQTQLPITEIAFAAGFRSLRRFNQSFQDKYARAPREFRKAGPAPAGDGITLSLPVLEPYDWNSIFSFLERHAIPGVEEFFAGRYRRHLSGGATLEVRRGKNCVEVTLQNCETGAVRDLLARVRHLFDLDHNPAHLRAALGGIRIPGAFWGFETAVAIILGQLVSVEGARASAHRLCRELGGGHFPEPAVLAGADLTRFGLTRAKARAISELSRLYASGEIRLDRCAPLEETRARLAEIHGIGPWTIELIALRCLSDPDAFPASDLIVARALQLKKLQPEDWRPWRAYLTLWVWKTYGQKLSKRGKK